LLLHFRAFFVPVNQIRTEQIEFVIQSDELTDQLVLHLAVHRFIVLSYPSRGLSAGTIAGIVQRQSEAGSLDSAIGFATGSEVGAGD